MLFPDIRQSIKTGRPCGDERFIIKMEKLDGRKLKYSQKDEFIR